MHFSRMGEKQWRQKTANTRKTPKIHEKWPKTVKIINIEIFAILYFLQMEFKSRKSQKIDAREKNTFTFLKSYISFIFFLRSLFLRERFEAIFHTMLHDGEVNAERADKIEPFLNELNMPSMREVKAFWRSSSLWMLPTLLGDQSWLQ